MVLNYIRSNFTNFFTRWDYKFFCILHQSLLLSATYHNKINHCYLRNGCIKRFHLSAIHNKNKSFSVLVADLFPMSSLFMVESFCFLDSVTKFILQQVDVLDLCFASLFLSVRVNNCISLLVTHRVNPFQIMKHYAKITLWNSVIQIRAIYTRGKKSEV